MPYLFSSEEFSGFFTPPMRDVTQSAEPVLDIWPYVDSIDLEALGVTGLHDVRHLYRDGAQRFDHILIGTERFNTLLAIIVDRDGKAVLGHHLLDLNRAYQS
ncbi:hypothetical protein [Novosphingobium rosa]|uniref:hypothetical protein n=1 Tax=Novosphingobium rosa TaxID=76978 RepID=UPI000835D754|nr:hypothetical protein [Novosphingobium rosa]